MTDHTFDLAACGWSAFFQSQVDIDELEITTPARVTAVYRGALEVISPQPIGVHTARPDAALRVRPPETGHLDDDEAVATVGDWLLLDRPTDPGTLPRVVRRLERKSLFKRRAAGTSRRVQLIAANVDTLFIVSSCNQDFNAARQERYLALAASAGTMPVMVLTKADLADDPAAYAAAAADLSPAVLVETLDARDPAAAGRLHPWCAPGQTVALVGSSGVGKSTLLNTLAGHTVQAVNDIREDDAKGRHTTTGRSLHRLPAGGWLLDTPGMRELQMTDIGDDLDDAFADIAAHAEHCRFADCRHDSEPGCAVRAAIEDGALDPARLKRYRKLAAEDAHNTETLAQRRHRARAFGRMVKSVAREKERWRGG